MNKEKEGICYGGLKGYGKTYCEMIRLQQENNQLKNELSEQMKLTNEENLQCSKYAIEITSLKEQRQELRSWLEDEIKEIDRHTTTLDIFNTYDYETIHEMETKKITYKNVLSKLNELEGKNDRNKKIRNVS